MAKVDPERGFLSIQRKNGMHKRENGMAEDRIKEHWQLCQDFILHANEQCGSEVRIAMKSVDGGKDIQPSQVRQWRKNHLQMKQRLHTTRRKSTLKTCNNGRPSRLEKGALNLKAIRKIHFTFSFLCAHLPCFGLMVQGQGVFKSWIFMNCRYWTGKGSLERIGTSGELLLLQSHYWIWFLPTLPLTVRCWMILNDWSRLSRCMSSQPLLPKSWWIWLATRKGRRKSVWIRQRKERESETALFKTWSPGAWSGDDCELK